MHIAKKNIYALLGSCLRKARVSKGLSGNDLGSTIHLSQQQVSRYELGVNKLSLDKLIEIIIFLDIDINEITNIIANQVEYEKNRLKNK
ncbi:helix-turn-helix domain-containing protein [Providencia sp. Me31A]|uniref:helix-turn-helix domain-containing protein n=1 Tax=Providencia sp. Me31A TaxID=3392637 RepID=UPI003D2DBE7B